jgi:hypothetical protein
MMPAMIKMDCAPSAPGTLRVAALEVFESAENSAFQML